MTAARNIFRHILIVPSYGFRRAYSGIVYFAEALRALGWDASFFIRCLQDDAEYYSRISYHTYVAPYHPERGFLSRKWNALTYRARLFQLLLKAPVVLSIDARYLRDAVMARKLRPNQILLNYCFELHLPEDYPDSNDAKIYVRYGRVPDIVIDTNEQRAAIRQERLKLARRPYVLINTIPQRYVDAAGATPRLQDLIGAPRDPSLPVLLHAGGVGKEKPLERVIDAVALARTQVFFLALCNADPAQVEGLSHYAMQRLEPGSFCIRTAIDRSQALAVMKQCDAGIVEYAVSVEPTANQRFCSPSKLFEFMGTGLAIIGSNNDNIRRVIESCECGVCAVDDSVPALARAIDECMADKEQLAHRKKMAREAFCSQFAYEKACFPVVKTIVDEIEDRLLHFSERKRS